MKTFEQFREEEKNRIEKIMADNNQKYPNFLENYKKYFKWYCSDKPPKKSDKQAYNEYIRNWYYWKDWYKFFSTCKIRLENLDEITMYSIARRINDFTEQIKRIVDFWYGCKNLSEMKTTPDNELYLLLMKYNEKSLNLTNEEISNLVIKTLKEKIANNWDDVPDYVYHNIHDKIVVYTNAILNVDIPTKENIEKVKVNITKYQGSGEETYYSELLIYHLLLYGSGFMYDSRIHNGIMKYDEELNRHIKKYGKLDGNYGVFKEAMNTILHYNSYMKEYISNTDDLDDEEYDDEDEDEYDNGKGKNDTGKILILKNKKH